MKAKKRAAASLSTREGRTAARDAVMRSNLPDAVKAALVAALDAGKFPAIAKGSRGRPVEPPWKKMQKAIRGMLIDLNAPLAEQRAEIKRLADERNISVAAMRDRIFRPGRTRPAKTDNRTGARKKR